MNILKVGAAILLDIFNKFIIRFPESIGKFLLNFEKFSGNLFQVSPQPSSVYFWGGSVLTHSRRSLAYTVQNFETVSPFTDLSSRPSVNFSHRSNLEAPKSEFWEIFKNS